MPIPPSLQTLFIVLLALFCLHWGLNHDRRAGGLFSDGVVDTVRFSILR